MAKKKTTKGNKKVTFDFRTNEILVSFLKANLEIANSLIAIQRKELEELKEIKSKWYYKLFGKMTKQ